VQRVHILDRDVERLAAVLPGAPTRAPWASSRTAPSMIIDDPKASSAWATGPSGGWRAWTVKPTVSQSQSIMAAGSW
jgi:hypothetical protein